MNNIEVGKEYVSRILDKMGNMPISELADYSFEDNLPGQIYKINRFLPQLFQDDSEKKYIGALQLALETSYKNGLYQFAYIQYHMLFMSVLYFVALKISWMHKEEFNKVIYYLSKGNINTFYDSKNTRNGKIYFGSFALISESDFFLILRIIGMDDDMLGRLRPFVETRNKFAHANGNMMITTEEKFIEKIAEYNNELEKIFKLFEKDIVSLYFKTITDEDFYDPEIRSYIDVDEQIIEGFIRSNLLSRTEMNYLRKNSVSAYKEHKGFEEIKNLHYALCHYYDTINTNDDYAPIDDKYFQYKYRDKASEFIENELNIYAYSCVKDGIEFPLYECPDCEEEQLVYDRETDKYHCFHCDADFLGNELSFCSECDRPMRNIESCICHSCFTEKMEED